MSRPDVGAGGSAAPRDRTPSATRASSTGPRVPTGSHRVRGRPGSRPEWSSGTGAGAIVPNPMGAERGDDGSLGWWPPSWAPDAPVAWRRRSGCAGIMPDAPPIAPGAPWAALGASRVHLPCCRPSGRAFPGRAGPGRADRRPCSRRAVAGFVPTASRRVGGPGRHPALQRRRPGGGPDGSRSSTQSSCSASTSASIRARRSSDASLRAIRSSRPDL